MGASHIPQKLEIPDYPGLYLRFTTVTDAEEIFQLVTSQKEYLERYQHPFAKMDSPEDTKQAIQGTLNKIKEESWLQYRIVLDGRIIGTITLYDHNTAAAIASLGYWISEHEQGHGYITAAARRAVELGFELWNLQGIYLEIVDDNKASQKVATHLGAQATGKTHTITRLAKTVTYESWEISR